MPETRLRAVIDTNVVLEGLTKRGGAAGLIMEAWLAGGFDVYVSNALVYECVAVLSRKLNQARWQRVQPVLETLLRQAEFVTIYFSWQPMSPDRADEHVIDCAMNAGAMVVTSNLRDFAMARQALGLRVVTPIELVNQLAS